MKNHYTVTKSWVKGIKNDKFIEPFIPKNSGIVVISECNGQVKFYHQGHSVCNMDYETFDSIPKIESNFSEEFINDYIIPNENIKNLKKLFSLLFKEYSNNPLVVKALKTLKIWIFTTKGSSAISGSQYQNLDFNNLPWETSKGFSAKPFDYNENRSGRTTVYATTDEITKWSCDGKEVLPIGIKENEHCSYSEMYKIGKKLFQEMCGMEGIDEKFKSIVGDFLPEINKDYKHYDYMTNQRVTLEMFINNTHHGKKKGLELCHLNPSLTSATFADNITIGFSESNRKQSGNSLDEMAIKGAHALQIKMNIESLITSEQLRTILQLDSKRLETLLESI